MNVFNAIGRIGKDAATRYTAAGKPVTGWSLAVDSGWGDKKQTLWLDCSLWGDRGEKVAPYILKGAQLGVTGSLGTREHEGKTYLTLEVRDVTLIKSGDGGNAEAAKRTPASKAPAGGGFGDMDSDVPFDRLARGIGGYAI